MYGDGLLREQEFVEDRGVQEGVCSPPPSVPS